MPPLTATATGKYANKVMDMTRAMNSSAPENGGAELTVQDSGPDAGYLIYVYNILDLEHIVEQPPLFAHFHIPACKKGEKVAYTVLPAFVNEVYTRAGTYETYTKKQDGRKAATSLLNPDALPSINWEGQQANWTNQFGSSGSNLNHLGVFWSLTRPDQTERLAEEVKIFKDIVDNTMREYVRRAERLHVSPRAEDRLEIGRLHHFAADYLGITAPWHTPMHHMISCPNCGDPVRDGLIFHKDAWGDKCIIDPERYAKSIVVTQPKAKVVEEDTEEEVVPIARKKPGPKPKVTA